MQPLRLSRVVEPECGSHVKLEVVHDFEISADAELLRIAIHNLISNAVKYSGGNPVSVIIQHPCLIIRDEGIGIPESELSHIFQPFYRATNVGSASGKGIGLALAKSILERLGARISVMSQVETGTIFKVTFRNTL